MVEYVVPMTRLVRSVRVSSHSSQIFKQIVHFRQKHFVLLSPCCKDLFESVECVVEELFHDVFLIVHREAVAAEVLLALKLLMKID